MENMSIIYEALLEYHAETIAAAATRSFAEKALYKAIDQALQNGDRTAFITLTNELKRLRGDDR